MSLDWKLLLMLLGILGLMQAACWLLARGLGRRLERHVMALGVALPLVLLAPWLDRARLLLPGDVFLPIIPGAADVPGLPAGPAAHRHDLLNDTIYQLLPWEVEVRRALGEARLPLWSDLLEGGSSPWINPQAGVMSPVFLLARALPIQHHLLAALALKLLVAFEGAWLLCRLAGASRASSLLAAAGAALGGALLPWALFPLSAAAAWVPWLACGTIRLFRGAGGREVAVTALLTAALLLSGHPEVAAVGGLFVALCGLALARRASFRRGLGAAALAAVLGFGLAAPHLVPFALHLPQSQRAQEAAAWQMPPYRFLPSRPLSWFLPGFGQFMLAPISPRAFGIPFQGEFRGPFHWADADSGYTGLVAFAGSLAVLAARRRRAWPFLGFSLVSLLLAAQFLPLAHLIQAVPHLRTMAYVRFLPVGCLGLCIAGALGIDALLRSHRRRRDLLAAWVGLAVAAALSLARHADLYVAALWVLLAAGAALACWRPRLRAYGAALLGTVLLLDLGPWARNHLPTCHPALFYPRTGFIAMMEREVAAGGPFRAAGEQQTLFPSLLPVYGVADVRPHNPLAPMPYLHTLDAAFGFMPSMEDYFPAFGGVDHPFLDFLGVRVLASTIGHAPPRTLERIDDGSFGVFRLYRNPDALPRWFLPSGVKVIAEHEVTRWIARLRNPRRVAVFDARAKAWGGAAGDIGDVRLLASKPGQASLSVPGAGDRLLATSLPSPEGWRARAVGEPLETLVVNGAFLGVRVPAGASRVELRYRPSGFVPGVLAGILSLFVTAAILARGLKLPRRSETRKGEGDEDSTRPPVPAGRHL
ncbi:MAG TPA: YfhO family protein [Thermoanaerobaculia bacterium]|nr:YfhO family protein [Thermoanaerobaculia bacterium]